MSNLRIRERTEEEIKKLRIIAGFVISVFGLLWLNSFLIWLNYPYLSFIAYLMFINPFVFIMYMGPNGIIILLIINIFALGLIYSSIKPEFKGYFLLILGYISFSLTFLTMPTEYYFSIRNLPIYLIFVDIPILFMIIFGLIIIIDKKKDRFPDIVSLLSIAFSTILPFFLGFFL
ncbi:MAG: hypothetical protein HWN81_02920 [Candidatus Lokiarchaeota archaeon]|nr:hypothetical protein [Candidatus Lokiarchaeota archaeon]